ncbi:FecCD family ABC transporter permease [Lysinibacillus sp. FW12]|uniref:FecCD family ABC transporter permease n=1 Tax=Lysinibacillus sp. FW12 TaxID=3096079 RepID=UPI003D742A70
MSNCYLTPSQIKLKRKNISIMVILIVLIFITFIISMNTGVIKLTPLDILWTLLGQGDAQQQVILFEFRLPRIVIAVFVEMGLAISGAILQGVSKNALADPGILGINAGAGLAVMLYVSFFPITKAAPVYLLPVLAFIGAGLTAVIIYTLSYRRHEGITPMRLILTGVAVAAGISSAMIVLTLRLSPENYQFVATWLAGSIWGSNWLFVFSLLPWLVILLPFVFVKATVLNVLNLGELTTVGLGASIEKERRWLLVAAVGLAGASVSVSGGIGFVGLIAPHLARQLVGAKHQFLLPTAALLGGFLVLMADTVGRSILEPSEIPTGIVVAVIGAPYFLYLLARLKE